MSSIASVGAATSAGASQNVRSGASASQGTEADNDNDGTTGESAEGSQAAKAEGTGQIVDITA